MRNFIAVFLLLGIASCYGDEMTVITQKLGLCAGTKASVQWERIFSSDKKMKQYKIDTLPDDLKIRLKLYLIQHAADSDQPTVPGL
ncbi:MAG: hypothetical protein PHW64_04995 [Sulfuricurvum sp.]|nr:hypothetical protein [Sulfuricurvum sp.]